MAEKPIIFSGPMVRAILAGAKTQTRRIVRADCQGYEKLDLDERGILYQGGMREQAWTKGGRWVRAPFAAGDRLWVRETFTLESCREVGWYEPPHNDGRPIKCRSTDDDGAWWVQPHYRATDPEPELSVPNRDGEPGCIWRPSIFMPRWASRLTLEVTEVRVQRLQEIRESDILAEGLTQAVVASAIRSIASRYKVLPEHWIHGWEESLSFCPECAEKKLAELLRADPTAEYLMDGGWGIDGDSQAFCETCQSPLDNSFTDYACESELDHFERNRFDITSPEDCYSLERILGAQPWEGRELSERVHRLSWRALWDSINGKRAPWESNPWVWAISFKKVEA